MSVFNCTDVSYSHGNQRTHHYKDKSLHPKLRHTYPFSWPQNLCWKMCLMLLLFSFVAYFMTLSVIKKGLALKGRDK